MITIESTAMVSTISPQSSPMASGMPPIAACKSGEVYDPACSFA